MDIVAIGELLIDFGEVEADAEGYPTLKAQPGGAPANLLVAATACGCSTAMIGKVGDDVFGHLLAESLSARGVDVRGIVFDPRVYTTLAFVTLDAGGERTFSFARKPGADTRLSADELPWDLIKTTRLLHFGSLSLTDNPAREATEAAVLLARENGALISFDPNWRPAIWHDASAARTAMTWGFAHSDVVKLSVEDAAFYWDCPFDEAQRHTRRLLDEFGCKLVFFTLGAHGCWTMTPTEMVEVVAPSVVAVDTTGAGDTFTGTALAGLLEHGNDPAKLTSDDLIAITSRACEVASLSTTRRGGFPELARV